MCFIACIILLVIAPLPSVRFMVGRRPKVSFCGCQPGAGGVRGLLPAAPWPAGPGERSPLAAVVDCSPAPINTELQRLRRTDDDVVMTTGSRLPSDGSCSDAT